MGVQRQGMPPENPYRMFTLDLLYPAVLGSMIVLLFLRVANFNLVALTEPTTILGTLLVIYYVLGFINAKLGNSYGGRDTTIDCLSSIFIFICFFLLGFNENAIPGIHADPVDYTALYLVLILVFLTPILRRHGLRPRDFGFRDCLAIVSAFAGIVVDKVFSASPWWVIAVLAATLAVYSADLLYRGLRPR